METEVATEVVTKTEDSLMVTVKIICMEVNKTINEMMVKHLEGDNSQ